MSLRNIQLAAADLISQENGNHETTCPVTGLLLVLDV